MEEVRGLKRAIENMIEKYNAYMQGFLLLLALYTGIYKGIFHKNEQLDILIDIISILLTEIFILNIKDSIENRKLNEMKFSINTLTQLVPFDPNLLENFRRLINNSTTDLLISGVTCTNVLENYYSDLKSLLDKGVHIRLLISSDEAITDNAKLYFGLYGINNVSTIDRFTEEVKNKIETTLRVFEKYPELTNYYCEGKLEIKRTSCPFFVGFIGVDIYNSDEGTMKIIKVTHYMHGCKNTPECPREIFSSFNNDHWYKFYITYIKTQWQQATPFTLTDCSIRQ